MVYVPGLYAAVELDEGRLMLTVRLDKELEAAIARVARETGGSKSSVVREALLRFLEDIEDAALVGRARRTGGRAQSIAAIRKTLGLN
jgi:predicted DNA-binding protein